MVHLCALLWYKYVSVHFDMVLYVTFHFDMVQYFTVHFDMAQHSPFWCVTLWYMVWIRIVWYATFRLVLITSYSLASYVPVLKCTYDISYHGFDIVCGCYGMDVTVRCVDGNSVW